MERGRDRLMGNWITPHVALIGMGLFIHNFHFDSGEFQSSTQPRVDNIDMQIQMIL